MTFEKSLKGEWKLNELYSQKVFDILHKLQEKESDRKYWWTSKNQVNNVEHRN